MGSFIKLKQILIIFFKKKKLSKFFVLLIGRSLINNTIETIPNINFDWINS